MFRHFSIALSLIVLLFANSARADSHEEKFRQYLPQIQTALLKQDIVKTLRNYNRTRSDMTEAEIEGLEAIWQAEMTSSNKPLVTGVIRNVTALRMKNAMRETGGIVLKINLVDTRGLSVAQTAVFPTIWQGSTESITNVATIGAAMPSIGDIAYDSATHARQFVATVPVTDPETQVPVGAAILVVDADALAGAYPDHSF